MTKEIYNTISKLFSDTYQQLYNSTPATDIIISYFAMYHDNDMKKDPEYKEAATDFAKFRNDILTSDRECAAFYIAVSAYERQEQFKKLATA